MPNLAKLKAGEAGGPGGSRRCAWRGWRWAGEPLRIAQLLAVAGPGFGAYPPGGGDALSARRWADTHPARPLSPARAATHRCPAPGAHPRPAPPRRGTRHPPAPHYPARSVSPAALAADHPARRPRRARRKIFGGRLFAISRCQLPGVKLILGPHKMGKVSYDVGIDTLYRGVVQKHASSTR